VLAVTGVRLPVLASFLGAVPIGMVGLAVLLAVRAATGSLADAGVAAGAVGVGNAIGLVVQGRLISRWGLTLPLAGAAVLGPAALVAFAVGARPGVPVPVLAALAVAAGAGLPATTSGMRALWPALVTDPRLRTTAYSVLATQFQVAMVAGPLLVSALLPVGGPAGALIVAAALAGSTGLAFAVTPAARRWRPVAAAPTTAAPPKASPTTASPATTAPLVLAVARRPGLRTVLVGSAGGGGVTGLIAVGVPAVTGDGTALVGALFAAFAAGELVGGLCYGGTRWRSSAADRLMVAQLCVAAGTGCLAALAGAPPWMLPVMFLVGAVTAPVSILNSALLDELAPVGPSTGAAGALARAYTVLVAVGLLGGAAGNAAGGLLDRAGGPRMPLVAGALTAVLVAAWIWNRRATLTARDGAGAAVDTRRRA
jgi:MFS family permease